MFYWRVLLSALIVVCAPSLLHAQTVVWDANPEPDVSGYRVSYGTQPGNYPNQVDVGNQTQYQPSAGFDWSRTLYFAVRAYNTSGLTSPYSAEVQWVPPAPPKITSVKANVSSPLVTGQPVTFTATATTGGSAVEYRFWLYRLTGWTLVQEYSSSNTFTWTPSRADQGEPYYVQAWVRRVGSTALYESWLGTQAFAVTAPALDLWADVDFPTPPGNQVTWTAQLGFSTTTPMEYKFLVTTQGSGVWTVFRDYASSNLAQWTPAALGTYAVQVWARPVGSPAQYEYTATSSSLEISRTALSVTGLFANTTFPALTGTKITWTARVKGGMAGPIQYAFWFYSAQTGWKLAQPYSASPTFAWTPVLGDEGEYGVQVHARSYGSTATYESWRTSTLFRIERAPVSLSSSTLFPVAPGTNIMWTATPANPSPNLQYQFWVYSGDTAAWTIAKPYSTDQTFLWIPGNAGSYAVQVWTRPAGSSVASEASASSGLFEVSNGPAQVKTLTSSATLPAAPGTTITWTAASIGGTAGPLQYQFWRWSGGAWTIVQSYSSLNTYTWTPTIGNIGDHAIQVWVRSAGSTALYESYKNTSIFSIR